ncbi:MAG TPA: rhodanese-like domain-containing protein [Salinimicrobium sp.]|nr:rhodanese-like domain-containing protein [Salinimicrobium sp.]
MKDLNQEEWREKTSEDKDAIIIDVRTPEEVEDGFIPGAINVDIYDAPGFMNKINSLDKEKNYYIYCKSGGRSSQACAIMEQIGFDNTYNLSGGFSQWNGEKEV